jgi:hypothetical protein
MDGVDAAGELAMAAATHTDSLLPDCRAILIFFAVGEISDHNAKGPS